MDVVKAVLVADPRCLLWRNEIGSSTHWPTGEKRKGPIRYGVANPGGSDLLGCYGPRYLAVETKTVRGKQSPEQVTFERAIAARGGVYAICRSEADARSLLCWLRSGVPPIPREFMGDGQLHATGTTHA